MSSASEPIVLGLDGGGTNTRAVIASGREVLCRIQGRSIKRLRVGPEAAEANLRSLLSESLAALAPDQRIQAASAGVASASMPGVKEWITRVFLEFGISRCEVVGDEVIALDAAFHGGPGILQIAGTGSNCIGRTADGELESVGGHSSILGDEGSGYWIGLHGVRYALKAHDRGDPNTLLDRVAQQWGTHSLEELVHFGNSMANPVNGSPGPDFSALAPVVSLAAEEGDPVALQVLHQASADLAESILLVRKKLRLRHQLIDEVPVAFTGSVLEKMALVRNHLAHLLSQAAPLMPFRHEAVVAVDGALWRARLLANSTAQTPASPLP